MGLSTSILRYSFGTQISTVLTARGQVRVVHRGKLERWFNLLALARLFKWQKGLKGTAAGRQAAGARHRLLLRLLCDLREQRLLSIQLLINSFWYSLIFTQERHKAGELQRGLKKIRGDEEPRSCPQYTPKLQNNFLLQEQCPSLYLRLWLIRSHRAGWNNFSICKSYWTSPSSWKPNHCVQSTEQEEEAGLGQYCV